jgi:thioredoxin-like negative regulator of GroEL
MPIYPLDTQAEFEKMWFHTESTPLPGTRPRDMAWIQYHTAKWCGPCRQLDLAAIVAAAEERGLSIWKIDVDVNDYTSGYCGVRTIPTFQLCVPHKIVSTCSGKTTDGILAWIKEF